MESRAETDLLCLFGMNTLECGLCGALSLVGWLLWV